MKRLALAAVVTLLCLCLVACETMSYYGQAVAGQFYILSHREDIQKLINDENSPPELKHKLKTILSIRGFAEQSLNLPLDNNYSTYVDLQRPYVVWNVFATPEFSMTPVNWCYPIAGCVSYRGYFDEQEARQYASQFNKTQSKTDENYDVYVGGVAAYSTLGWFSDSILNTIINREDYQLASLIFHELAHQVVYLAGETEFNESFATAVEQEGLKRWLEYVQQSNPQNDNKVEETIEETIRVAELNRQRQTEFVALIKGTVEELTTVYSSEQSEIQMRHAKQQVLAQLQIAYTQLKQQWGYYDGYDAWFSREINNAQLSTVTTYNSWVPAFQHLLKQEQNDLSSFYESVKHLADLPPEERMTTLKVLLEAPSLPSLRIWTPPLMQEFAEQPVERCERIYGLCL